MCGLFGIIGHYDPSKAKKALKKLSHRGPDYCNIVEKNSFFFGHHRLSVQDPSSNVQQPYQYKDIYALFNGEIYNFKELRKELQDQYSFQTDTDGEVIIASYIKWGIDFVQHLRGMFAIAIYDKETLYLFRDRLGKKPLFYLHNKKFHFASEIKALTPFLNNHEINEDALLSYLSFLAPTPPHTFYKGIKKLAAGEYLIYKNSQVEVKRYFDLLDNQANIITSQEEAIYELNKSLSESISIRLQSDVPIASLLSGGIDSATINSYALRENKKLPTYTLGYKGFSKYDETKNAQESARLLGIDNKTIIINQEDFLQASDKVLESLDEPLNDPAAVPLYLLFEEIAMDGYKVVLSGEGSDELFLGYRQYFEFLDIQKAGQLKNKNWLKNYFKSNYSQNREWEYYKRVFNSSLLFRSSGENFTDLQKNLFMKRNIKDNQSLQYIQSYRDRFENSSHLDEATWYSYIDLNLYQAEHFLTKLDRVSMAHSIESRTPFLDHKLASLVFRIAPQLKYKDGITKSLLKSVIKERVPQTILKRKKKGFSNPYLEYLIDSQKISLIEEVNKKTNLFKKEALISLLQKGKSGGFKQHIWGLYVLSVWINKNIL